MPDCLSRPGVTLHEGSAVGWTGVGVRVLVAVAGNVAVGVLEGV